MLKNFLFIVFLVNLAGSVPRDLRTHKRHRQLRDSDAENRQTEPVYEFVNGVLKAMNEETDVQSDQPANTNTSQDKKPTLLAYTPNKDSRSYQANRRKPDGTVRFESKVETMEHEGNSKILTRSPNRRGPSRIEDATSKDSIVFPDEYERNYFNPIINPKCTKTFCTEIDNYPEKHIEAVLKPRLAEFRDLLGSDALAAVNITQRIDTNEEYQMCNSKEELVKPTTAKNMDDEWFYIANSGDIEQVVRVEMCEKDNQKCNLSHSFPIGYESQCKQKYIYRKLLAINNRGTPITDNFKLPSCCTCFYTTNGAKLTSFGSKQTPRRP